MSNEARNPNEPGQKPRGSIWSIVIAGLIALVLFLGFSLLAAPLVGVVMSVVMVFVLLSIVAIAHYVLWGRWIGDTIRREVEEEERQRPE